MTDQDYTVPDAFAVIHSNQDLAFRFVERVREDLQIGFDLYGGEPYQIPNEAYPGFFPFTDGGWQAQPQSCLSSARGSGRHNGLLSEAIVEAEQQAREAWNDEHDGGPDPFIDNMSDDDREAWYEYERGWLDQFYLFEVRATYYAADNVRNQSGFDEVHFMVMVNFDEYGRDGRGIKLWEQNVIAGLVTERAIDALVKEATSVVWKVEAIAEPTK